ncbi:SDR family NAD(P)-dependent oxidoreductase [Umezawaea tangerina]|uniref:NAD(P)-dependent dehydrogenase (Short-subunit alcohol dehydrogenase family) n=1 Tax=Umezawaea tangerina TaxID=84725 RepID=A0A2T0SWZ4_9PSEU|nr:SDR family oxidoreductase [Umezawaea tangerina]PRY37925.1 NAD(P)-dependent dehydrogenase (short-subunit alcohol dehydrogenase family) [Umezawaea tangerina]
MKIAIVTGANRGLGRNAALALARRGVDLVITYRSNAAEADAVVQEVAALGRTAVALPLDVGATAGFAGFTDDVRRVLKGTWDRDTFDFLVNNAGIGIHSSFADTTEEVFDEQMAVHFKGVFFLTQALLPVIADGGRILNVSSGLARFAGPGYAAYGSMKGAVEVLTRYLAKELGPRGITVNVIAPGPVETDFGGGVVRDNADVNAALAAQIALGRVGVPDDIGGVVASLLSDDNAWITGQRIEASGGMLL